MPSTGVVGVATVDRRRGTGVAMGKGRGRRGARAIPNSIGVAIAIRNQGGPVCFGIRYARPRARARPGRVRALGASRRPTGRYLYPNEGWAKRLILLSGWPNRLRRRAYNAKIVGSNPTPDNSFNFIIIPYAGLAY